MLLWSYFSVVFTDPGGVPPNYRPLIDQERGEMDPLEASESVPLATPDSTHTRIRYCRKCNQLKPPRCHHCSVCGRCVLKMDHHCVWVVNCVGALNYKYFLLFLFYTFLETTVVTAALLPRFIVFFSDEEIPGSPSTLATTFFAFAANTTTIEAYEKKTTARWRYDLGRKRNFEQCKLYIGCCKPYISNDLTNSPHVKHSNFVLIFFFWNRKYFYFTPIILKYSSCSGLNLRAIL
ncbi:putative protein S-acyltransferase [Helianthus annuus]|nr:putative protein S-acyltransferase [Helianthus annuus]